MSKKYSEIYNDTRGIVTMKRNMLHIIRLTLCFAMCMFLFAGCDKKENDSMIVASEAPQFSEATSEATEDTAEEIHEEVPELIPQVAVLETFSVEWLGRTDTYEVGKNLVLDEYGRISQIIKRSETVFCTYGENGELVKASSTKDDVEGAFQTWNYENNEPTSSCYDPNGGFRSRRDTTFEIHSDEEGLIQSLAEKIKLTDSDDGSISYRDDLYEYSYAENYWIDSIAYYSKGKMDHTTEITYDDDGNILSYVNVGADSKEAYLKIQFTYKMVDGNSITPMDKNNFIELFNWESLLSEFIL